MELKSMECRQALVKYRTTRNMEKLAIKVLLTKARGRSVVANIPEINDMSSGQIAMLAQEIVRIMNNIGIEDGA